MDDSAERRLGAWVRLARGERGWSQRELAGQLAARGIKLDPSAITRLEKGQRPIRLDEAAAIGEVFGVSISEMLTPINFYAKAVEAGTRALSLYHAADEQHEICLELLNEAGDIQKPQKEPELEASRQAAIKVVDQLINYDDKQAKRRLDELYQALREWGVEITSHSLSFTLERHEGGWWLADNGASIKDGAKTVDRIGPFTTDLQALAMATAITLRSNCEQLSIRWSRDASPSPEPPVSPADLPTVDELIGRIQSDRLELERLQRERPTSEQSEGPMAGNGVSPENPEPKE